MVKTMGSIIDASADLMQLLWAACAGLAQVLLNWDAYSIIATLVVIAAIAAMGFQLLKAKTAKHLPSWRRPAPVSAARRTPIA